MLKDLQYFSVKILQKTEIHLNQVTENGLIWKDTGAGMGLHRILGEQVKGKTNRGRRLLASPPPLGLQDPQFFCFSAHMAGRGPAQPLGSCQQKLNGLAQEQFNKTDTSWSKVPGRGCGRRERCTAHPSLRETGGRLDGSSHVSAQKGRIH